MTEPPNEVRTRRHQLVTGAALVVFGLTGLALQHLGGPGRAVVLVLAGGAFLCTYLYTRRYGFLIPGGILSGFGLGWIGEWYGVPLHDATSAGLGLGFLAIYAIDALHRRRQRWWPLIPGIILVVNGAGATAGDLVRMAWRWFPLAIVLLGVILILRAWGRGGGGDGPAQP